eukprot:1370558-Amorphochlora_amoeboformis.AAC.2
MEPIENHIHPHSRVPRGGDRLGSRLRGRGRGRVWVWVWGRGLGEPGIGQGFFERPLRHQGGRKISEDVPPGTHSYQQAHYGEVGNHVLKTNPL